MDVTLQNFCLDIIFYKIYDAGNNLRALGWFPRASHHFRGGGACAFFTLVLEKAEGPMKSDEI
jgi:hypothetical protein